jgi:hypothetical protein
MSIKRIDPAALDTDSTTVRSPVITSISNTQLSGTGGDTVVITGQYFQTNVSVYFGSVSANNVVRSNSNSISFSTPSLSPGTYSVYVVNQNGGTAVIPVNVYMLDAYWTPGATQIANLTTANRTINQLISLDSGTNYSLYSGSLPPGINFYSGNATVAGTISNINIDTTTYNFTIRAYHTSYGLYFNKNYSILFTATYPTWTTSANLGVITQNFYSVTVNATSDSNVTYSAVGTLPSGYSIAANTGVLSGSLISPDANYSSTTVLNLTLRATDQETNKTDKVFSLTYNPIMPTWVTDATLTVGYKSYAYSQTLSATGFGSITYALAPGSSLPTGLSLNSSTGAITGTPTDTANATFTVIATDSQTHSSAKTFNLTIYYNYITASGGNITTAGGYRTHTFNSSSNFVVTGLPPTQTVSVLVVAGGGGGGGSTGGGGGAGGYVSTTLTLSGSGTYPVIVGAGGPGATDTTPGGPYGSDGVIRPGTQGVGSSVFGYVAVGGGKGAGGASTEAGVLGGSGGGGSGGGGVGGAGTTGQGNAGGTGVASTGTTAQRGGGGGGAGGAGGSPSTGGNGITIPIVGGLGLGGGNGGGSAAATTAYGGGLGGTNSADFRNAGIVRGGNATTIGSGGGGGGGGFGGYVYYYYHAGGGNGYDGVVIIRYPYV